MQCLSPCKPKKRKSKPLLDGEEFKLLVGFIIWKNSLFQEVHPEGVISFAWKAFHKKLSETAVRNCLRRAGLTIRAAKTQKLAKNDSIDSRLEIYLGWISQLRKSRFFEINHSFICSIDFTFTSQRTIRTVTISPMGGFEYFFFEFFTENNNLFQNSATGQHINLKLYQLHSDLRMGWRSK